MLRDKFWTGLRRVAFPPPGASKDFGELPDCVVTYEIETSGETMKLTLTESHSWDVPPAILAGGRAGWPKIISGLKSMIETGKPLRMAMEGPPPGMIKAVQ